MLPFTGIPNASTPNPSGTATSGARKISRASRAASRYSLLRIGLDTMRLSSLRMRACTMENPTPHMPLLMSPIATMPGISQSIYRDPGTSTGSSRATHGSTRPAARFSASSTTSRAVWLSTRAASNW